MSVVMVTGGTGQLGRALIAHAWPKGVRLVAPERGRPDLSDVEAVLAFIAAAKVTAVINAAAYTDVDGAESEPALAFSGNATVPAALAQAARAADVPLVHVSTDYVFDGASERPYEADDPIAPINAYGASKAAGEFAVRAIQPRSAVVRTSWLVSPHGKNFVRTMIRLAGERTQIGVVADQRGRPTIAADLAGALATVSLRMIHDRRAPTGVFHAANEGETSWHGFAQAIFGALRDLGGATPELAAISTTDYRTAARRPANSVLSTTRLARDYGVALGPWARSLPALVHDALRSDS